MKIKYDGSFLIPAQVAGGIARDSEELLFKFSKHFEMEIFYPERYFLRKYEYAHTLKVVKILQKIITLVLGLFHSSLSYSDKEIYWQSQPSTFIPPKNSIWILRLHDLFPITFPRDYSMAQRKIFMRSVKEAVSRAIIVVNSSHTKKQLELQFGRNATIFTVPCHESQLKQTFCQRCSMCKSKASVYNRYILTVGTLFKRRNLNKLICFSSKLFTETSIQTKVVGRFTSPLQRIFLNFKAKKKNIEFLGSICDGQLEQIYKSAMGYLTLSEDEGFNIPLLDAICHDLPILASDIPAHRELINNINSFDEDYFVQHLKGYSRDSQLFKQPRPSLKDETDQLIVFIENLTHV